MCSSNIFYIEIFAEKYIEKLKLRHKSVHVHNAISDSSVSSCCKTITNSIHLLFLHSFKEWRHPMIVVKASHILLLQGYNVRVKIAGNDPSMPPRVKIASDMQSYIDCHNNSDKIVLEDWTYSPQDFFNWAHFFKLPAETVCLNISLLEAMAAGCVPITSNIDPDTKRIFGKYNHILTSPPNPQDFADSILNIISSPSKYSHLSRASIAIINSKFLMSAQLLKLTK